MLRLLDDAGHAGFRGARGPLAFTQRQAGGRFTRDETAAFIDRLQDEEETLSAPPGWLWLVRNETRTPVTPWCP